MQSLCTDRCGNGKRENAFPVITWWAPVIILEGIAAANVEIPGTDVSATTIHALFDLDAETFTTRLDFAKRTTKVETILALDVLLLDEAAASRKRRLTLD